MRARRSSPIQSEESAWSDGYEGAVEAGFDEFPAPRAVGGGPLRVCLSCGEAPGGRECPHEEVAALDDASAQLHAAALLLATLAQQRRSAERALRRLVEAAVRAGHGSIEAAAPPAAAPSPTAPLPAPQITPPTLPTRPRRRGATTEAQGFFAFAAPPPPPPPPPPVPEPTEENPAPAETGERPPSRRRRISGALTRRLPEAD